MKHAFLRAAVHNLADFIANGYRTLVGQTDDHKILAELKKRMSEGVSEDALVLFLRESGLSQGASSFFLQQASYGSAFQCKTIVFESKAWTEAHEGNKRLHAEIDRLIKE
ncbi:MAG: hypothetical protein J7485_13570 [Sphingobium sp.]|nr:hypothetical protein [Sphingobium sp.]